MFGWKIRCGDRGGDARRSFGECKVAQRFCVCVGGSSMRYQLTFNSGCDESSMSHRVICLLFLAFLNGPMTGAESGYQPIGKEQGVDESSVMSH